MDKLLLTSNIITFVGMSIATVAALFKAKRRVLLFQSGNHVLEIVAQFLTKAYSGMVQEIIALLYSLILVFVKSPKKAPKVIVSALCLIAGLAIGVVINVRFSGNVWYGYLPIVANVIYTLCVIVAFCADKDESQGDLLLKVGLMINVACWGVYGWFVRLYPVMAFNAAAFLFAAISVVRILHAKKRSNLPKGESMRKLFEIDKKDHFDCTREYVRNSARSIVIKAGKVAMVHSLLYDYYKFPGGGIEEGESPVEAMIRETREEAGLVVLPQTVKPFGCVRRVEKYGLDPSVRFVQDNFYYLCEVEDRVLPQALDEYEAEESFRLEFVAPIVAIEKNRLAKEGAHSSVMFEREARVLELLIKEGCFT